MKTKLFYFTGTGNTLVVAKDLAKELGDAEVIAIKELVKESEIVVKDCNIGIVFPVYAWGPPLMVTDFINKLKTDKSTYIFAVAVYGGMLASTLGIIEEQLKSKDLKMSMGFAVNMPGNCVSVYDALKTEKQEEMFAKEKVKIKEIAQAVKNKKVGKYEKNLGLFGAFLSKKVYKGFALKMKEGDKDYTTDEKCNKCGTCIKVCPVGNISMVNNQITWNHNCQACYACIQWCPQKAIQKGPKTAARSRYHHPNVTLKDIMK